MIPIHSVDAERRRLRGQPKGRQVDPAVLAQVQGWLGPEPLRRDRLVEILHIVNDRLRCLPAPHLAALAQLMKLSQAEVFEVASFYHHFEVVKEGADGRVPAAPLTTVRSATAWPAKWPAHRICWRGCRGCWAAKCA